MIVWSLDEDAQKITFPSWTGNMQAYQALEKKGNTLRVQHVDNFSTT